MIRFQKECGHWERAESLLNSGSTLEQLEKGRCGKCEKMKKCKVCGGAGRIEKLFSAEIYVICQNFDCEVAGPSRASEDEAVAGWNRLMTSEVVYEVGEASDEQNKENSKLVLVLPEGVKKVTYEW